MTIKERVLLSNSHKVAIAAMGSGSLVLKVEVLLVSGCVFTWEKEVRPLKEENGVSERFGDSGEGVASCWSQGKADYNRADPRQVTSVWAMDEITNVHLISFS